MAFSASPLQLRIFSAIQNDYSNIVLPSYIDRTKPINICVNAVAGSGKSTTIIQGLRYIPSDKQVLFLAFNKHIVEELKGKISSKDFLNVDIKTLHGFGMSALNFSFRGCQLDNNKYKNIVETEIRYDGRYYIEDEAERSVFFNKVYKLIDLGRLTLSSSISELENVAFDYDIELLGLECELAMKCILRGSQIYKIFDFTDMIYLPVKLKLKVKTYDHVIIDECQDLSKCQRELMLMSVNKNGGKFISVGDPQQSIYFFSGASCDSFSELENQPNTITLPLSVCYRCDKAFIELAKQYVPEITARDGADEGIFNEDAKISDVIDGDLILCRNTFPLISLCLKYLSEGKKAHIIGRDISTSLTSLLKNNIKKSVSEVFTSLNEQLKTVESKIMAKENLTLNEVREHPAYIAFDDKIKAIEAISKNCESVKQIIEKIESIFGDKNSSGIKLSTIHKSKGLEADRVFIVHKELTPAKYARKNKEMLKQEYNLIYISITRAKHYLGYITDFNAYDRSNQNQ